MKTLLTILFLTLTVTDVQHSTQVYADDGF
jgi:hypothetical protein